jgi:hypothetical protein
MKQNKKELDVDIIGGQGPLTKEEAEAISKFIKASKKKKANRISRKTKTASLTSSRVRVKKAS